MALCVEQSEILRFCTRPLPFVLGGLHRPFAVYFALFANAFFCVLSGNGLAKPPSSFCQVKQPGVVCMVKQFAVIQDISS